MAPFILKVCQHKKKYKERHWKEIQRSRITYKWLVYSLLHISIFSKWLELSLFYLYHLGEKMNTIEENNMYDKSKGHLDYYLFLSIRKSQS